MRQKEKVSYDALVYDTEAKILNGGRDILWNELSESSLIPHRIDPYEFLEISKDLAVAFYVSKGTSEVLASSLDALGYIGEPISLLTHSTVLRQANIIFGITHPRMYRNHNSDSERLYFITGVIRYSLDNYVNFMHNSLRQVQASLINNLASTGLSLDEVNTRYRNAQIARRVFDDLLNQ